MGPSVDSVLSSLCLQSMSDKSDALASLLDADVKYISAIPFTAKRERDTRLHLLQNATVKNIIDCKTIES